MELNRRSELIQRLLRKLRYLVDGKEAFAKKIVAIKIDCGGGMKAVQGAGVDVALKLFFAYHELLMHFPLGNAKANLKRAEVKNEFFRLLSLNLFDELEKFLDEHAPFYNDLFDCEVGVSAGAGNILYSRLGLARAIRSSSMYWNILTHGFISKFPPHLDMNILKNIFIEGPNKVDIAKIRNSRTDFLVAATNIDKETLVSGDNNELIDVKKALPDFSSAILASMAIPRLCGKPVVVNGNRYIDFGYPLPCRKLIRKYAPTDVLIITNRHYSFHDIEAQSFLTTLGDHIFDFFCLKGLSESAKNTVKHRNEILARGQKIFDRLKKISTNVIFVWAVDPKLELFTVDGERLKNGFIDSLNETLSKLEESHLSQYILI